MAYQETCSRHGTSGDRYMTHVTGAANAGDINVCCGILVGGGNDTFPDMSSNAKPSHLHTHYKPSKFVMGSLGLKHGRKV